MQTKIIFLDRDGVINRDSSEFIKSWQEFHFLPGSLKALKELTLAGFKLLLITNQSGLARGFFSEQTLQDIHQRMCHQIAAAGGQITDIFYCPHAPGDNCECRKPKPGLIIQASKKYGIDPHQTIMIGDRASDLECGFKAGCQGGILIKSQHWGSAIKTLTNKPLYTADTLLEAVQWIMQDKIKKTGLTKF